MQKIKQAIVDIFKQVGDLIYQKHKLKLHMGIGSECTNIEDYFNSYLFAHQVVNIGRMKDILLTIKTYFENGMKIGNTAQAMYIHRNTVLNRLKKFKELFHIDINNSYQCMLVYIGITLKQLN
ncbi:MAG: transcriptional regulator, CdaR [Clostridiaceae bacterium]|nr:transcriptional regulator, CdaR [Clostridiaceae bacterium]